MTVLIFRFIFIFELLGALQAQLCVVVRGDVTRQGAEVRSGHLGSGGLVRVQGVCGEPEVSSACAQLDPPSLISPCIPTNQNGRYWDVPEVGS